MNGDQKSEIPQVDEQSDRPAEQQIKPQTQTDQQGDKQADQLEVTAQQHDTPDAVPTTPVPARTAQEEMTETASQPSQTESGNFFHPETSQDALDSDSGAGMVSNSGQTDDPAAVPASLAPARDPLVWTSSAAASSHKGGLWLVSLLAGAAIIAAIVYFVSKDTVSAGAVVLAAVLFGAFGLKKPHAVSYVLDNTGITIGRKHFIFTQFRSFSIVDEGDHTSIALLPLKRFLPLLSISYDPQLQEQIVSFLAGHLPVEQHKKDAFDAITSHIKF